MQISTNQSTTAMSMAITDVSASPPPPPPQRSAGGEAPVSHANAVQQLGQTLSNTVKDEIVVKAQELEESGASFEEVKSFVDNALEENGAKPSEGSARSGQFVDIFA